MHLSRTIYGTDPGRRMCARRLGFLAAFSDERNQARVLAAREANGVTTSPGRLCDSRNAVLPAPDVQAGFPGSGLVVDPAVGHTSRSANHLSPQGLILKTVG